MCELKAKYDEWREWLYGDDIHSICRQIRTMIWDAAVFHSMNELRRYTSLDKNGEPMNNGMVHSFINRSFFDTQVSAIRRLLDKETQTGPRSVISLWRLVDDMQKNSRLLTRQNIIATLGYPYDYQATEAELYRQRMTGSDGERVFAKKHIFCVHSKHVHKNIDVITGISSDKRASGDAVPVTFFEWAKERLNSTCQEINTYVNKFFAHSATPESREIAKANDINVTYGHILEAHKVICEVTDLLCRCFFNRSHGGYLPTVAYDQFEHLDKPWATEETVQKLRKHWREYHKHIEASGQWDWQSEYNKHLTGEIEA